MNIIKRIITAVTFLTIMPLPNNGVIQPKEFGKSMAYFPLVGLLIGALLIGAQMVLIKIFSPLTTTVLLIAFWSCLTGFLHLEGFVDAIDGFSASSNKERILDVMKDHHCGAKGVVAIVFLIIVKIVLLSDIPAYLLTPALVLTPAVSRWVMLAASLCPHASNETGLGKTFVENSGSTEVVIASIILMIAGLSLLRIQFIVLMIPVLILVLLFLSYVIRKINGVTGDILGAMNELTEAACLGTFVLLR
jgi:adenosylcobinamide-GDP ribazoletransferase